MPKCNVCGKEFEAISEKRYVAVDTREAGMFTAEPTEYDAFDCPFCGCQYIAQPRKRAVCALHMKAEDEET